MAGRLLIICALLSAVAVANVVTETRLAGIGVGIERDRRMTRELREQIRRLEFEISCLKTPQSLSARALALQVDLNAPGSPGGVMPDPSVNLVAGRP